MTSHVRSALWTLIQIIKLVIIQVPRDKKRTLEPVRPCLPLIFQIQGLEIAQKSQIAKMNQFEPYLYKVSQLQQSKQQKNQLPVEQNVIEPIVFKLTFYTFKKDILSQYLHLFDKLVCPLKCSVSKGLILLKTFKQSNGINLSLSFFSEFQGKKLRRQRDQVQYNIIS